MLKKWIAIVLLVSIECSAQGKDSAFNVQFDKFRSLTDSLIGVSQKAGINDPNKMDVSKITPSITFHCSAVRQQLSIVDAGGGYDFKISEYFSKGERIRSQDISSPISQMECDYYYFASAVRKATKDEDIIKAALILNEWITKGFPPTMYCPYFYAPVEVEFGPKKVSGDSIFNKKKEFKTQ